MRDLAHSVKMDHNYILSTPWCTRLFWCSAEPKSGHRWYRLIKRCHVMLCYVTVEKCLMFREDSIAELSFCRSVQLMLISLKKKTNREEPYRVQYGDPRIRKRFLTRGNRQCCTVGIVPSPQLLLPCEVPHCTTRHGAPRSYLNSQKETQGRLARDSVYTGETKQRFGYEGTDRTACHSV